MPDAANEQPYDLTVVDNVYTLTLSGLGAQGIPGPAIATELEVTVRNQSGAPMTKGTIVYLDGSTGQKPLIEKAQANNDANSAQTIGFLKDTINNNADGVVIVSGLLENIDTQGLGDGTQLYLSPTTAGTWTTTKPSAPNHLVYVGIVVKAHITQGVIYVSVQNGYELNELHDVAISSPATGQFLKRNAGDTLWVNSSIVSADVTDATNSATPNTIVKRDAGGGASFAAGTGFAPAISATRTGGGFPVVSFSNTGLGPVVVANASSGDALQATSTTGDYHARFGSGVGIDQSFIARIKGALGWFRGAFTGRIQAADTLTADRTYTLPDSTGTVILDSTLGAGVNGLSTITGAKSFSGQVQLTGQAATDDNSAMTRGLVDTRDIGKMVYQVMPQNSGFNGVSFASVGGSNNSGVGSIINVQASSTLNNYGTLRIGSYLNMTPAARETVNFSRKFLLHGISGAAFGGTLNEGRTFWPGNGSSYTTGGMVARAFGWLQVGPNLYGQTHDGTTLRTTTAFAVRTNASNDHLAIYGDGAGNYSFYRNGTLLETLTGPTGSVSSTAPTIICSAENKESGQNMFVNWQSLELISWT